MAQTNPKTTKSQTVNTQPIFDGQFEVCCDSEPR